MFGKKTPVEYKTSARIEINATPQQVFTVIDPSSSDYCLRQLGFEVESDPENQDSFLAQHPEMPDEYHAIVVSERILPDRLQVSSERLSESRLLGYLLSSSSIYTLSTSDTGGTIIDLSECAQFHPKAKGAVLEMEQQIFEMAIQGHLEKVCSFCELPPERNEHHPLYNINEFWAWFVNNEQPLRTASIENSELLGELGERLQKASAYLSFEMRTLDNGTRELAIHADGMKAGFPVVEQTVSVAPQEVLPEWRIVAYKQPKGAMIDMGIIDSVRFDPRGMRYLLEPINEHGTRDITLFFDTYTRRTRELHMGRGFFVLDHSLGEYRTATAIGEIELAAISKAGDDSKPIDLLASEFE